jgi:dephospho-CoA kinase
VVVDCSENIQEQRAINRSRIDAITFSRIKSNQVSRLIRLKAADLVINNNGTIEDLKSQVSKIHNYLLNSV